MKSGAGLAIAAISALAFGAAMKRKRSVSGSVGVLPAKITSGLKRRAALIVLLPSCGGPDPIQKQKASLQTVVEESGINYDCIYGICLNDAVESVRFNGEKLTFKPDGFEGVESYIKTIETSQTSEHLSITACGGRVVSLYLSSADSGDGGYYGGGAADTIAARNANIVQIMIKDGWQGEKKEEDGLGSGSGREWHSSSVDMREASHPDIAGIRMVTWTATDYMSNKKVGARYHSFFSIITTHPERVKLCHPNAAAVLKVMPLSPASPVKPQAPGESQAELERRARAEEAKLELERRAKLKEVEIELDRRQRRAERRRAELQALKSEPQ
jgi:hypothetical protein